VFKKVEAEWFSKTYNCYIFPEDNSGNNYLNMETSAIIFNRDHKMDFNKWIYQGIPYMTAKYEKTLLDDVGGSDYNLYEQKEGAKQVSLHKDEDKSKYEEFRQAFCEFYGNSEVKQHMWDKYPKYFVYYILNSLQPEIRKEIYFHVGELEG
jgi:hypothetical protein